jgi:hypothetical protein
MVLTLWAMDGVTQSPIREQTEGSVMYSVFMESGGIMGFFGDVEIIMDKQAAGNSPRRLCITFPTDSSLLCDLMTIIVFTVSLA